MAVRARRRPNTQSRRRRIRRQGFELQRDARAAMDAERARFVDVTDPSAVDVATNLRDWVDRRAANHSIRETTADSYRRIVATAAGQLSGIRLEKLTAADLDRVYHYLLTTGGQDGSGRSPMTVRYFHSVMRKALADAVRKGMVSRNVADLAEPPSAKSARAPEPAVWTVTDARSFLAADWLPEYRRVAWMLALNTGLRRGEMAGLEWSDIDGDRLSVRRTRTTAEHTRPVSEPRAGGDGARSVFRTRPADMPIEPRPNRRAACPSGG